MAYFVKTRVLESAGGAVVLPSGPTATRPTSPVNGQLRYNTDTSRFEIYYNAWKEIAINGNVNITKDSFTGDGSTVVYGLSAVANQTATQVFVGNVHQNPGVAYSITGSTLTFNSTPPGGQTIEVYLGFASTDAN
jgi:hypothetical protein